MYEYLNNTLFVDFDLKVVQVFKLNFLFHI